MKCSWPSGLMVLLLVGCGNDLAAPQSSLDQGEETNVWQAAMLGRVEPLKAALAKGSATASASNAMETQFNRFGFISSNSW